MQAVPISLENIIKTIRQFNKGKKEADDQIDLSAAGLTGIIREIDDNEKAAKFKKYGFAALGTVVLAGLGYFAFLNKDSIKPMAISTWNAFSSFCA